MAIETTTDVDKRAAADASAAERADKDPFKYKPPTYFDRMGELFIFFSIINGTLICYLKEPHDLIEKFAIFGLMEVTLLVVAGLGGALTNSAPPVPEGLTELLKKKNDEDKAKEKEKGKKGSEPKGTEGREDKAA